MAGRNYTSHRPKAHAIHDEFQDRWIFIEPVVMGSREQEFMRRFAAGRSMQQIAHEMGVSERTASSFSTDLQFKFQVTGVRKLFLIAIQLYPRAATIGGRARYSTREPSTVNAPGTAPRRAL
jgi:DNA-binding NarL/FixJ family response regulator